jgi:hypothetical protein
MGAVQTSETLVTIYQTAWLCIPEDSNLYSNRLQGSEQFHALVGGRVAKKDPDQNLVPFPAL